MLNMSFRYSDNKLEKLFKNEDLHPESSYYTFENRTLRCLELTTDPSLPYIVFVHGAPGSSADYLEYFRNERLYGKVNLFSVDRPGYGYSEFGNSETSIQKQASAIHSVVVQACNSDNIVLVGHSYGGPIVTRMAMDYPNSYSGIILLAPALDPENEKVIKIGHLAMIKPTRWLTPLALRVAADEKFSHVEELTKMVPLYGKVNIPVIHIHGTKDSLVPYKNLDFSRKHIEPKLLEAITLENVNHFLPWSHHNLIVDKILEMSASQ